MEEHLLTAREAEAIGEALDRQLGRVYEFLGLEKLDRKLDSKKKAKYKTQWE